MSLHLPATGCALLWHGRWQTVRLHTADQEKKKKKAIMGGDEADVTYLPQKR